jgi:serine/threonine protein kinase
MAPEQWRAQSSVDERADIHALGCVLHDMLMGRPAYMTVDPGAAWSRPLARLYAAALPHGLDLLIARMLARDPAGRPVSMAEVERALARLGNGELHPTLADGTRPDLELGGHHHQPPMALPAAAVTTPAPRRRRVIGAAIALAIGLCAGVAFWPALW